MNECIEVVYSMTKEEVKGHYNGVRDVKKCHNSAVSTETSALEQLKSVDVREFLP